MANFKALSSRFAFSTVLLLLVINNMYAAAAAACGSSGSSSKGMLFNSSSLEVVEEFAEGQETTTEIDADHEIRRRILQGRVVGTAWKLVSDTFGAIKGKMNSYNFDNVVTSSNFKKLKAVYDYMDGYCKLYCYPSNEQTNACTCGPYNGQAVTNQPSNQCSIFASFYCCTGVNGVCSLCCPRKNGVSTENRSGIILPPSYLNQSPLSSSSSSSSSSLSSSSVSPISYVVMAVIAICNIQSMLFF